MRGSAMQHAGEGDELALADAQVDAALVDQASRSPAAGASISLVQRRPRGRRARPPRRVASGRA